MASKFEQYLEILNNKQPKRGGSSVGMQGESANSPLRTKQYLLKTLNGETPSQDDDPSTAKQLRLEDDLLQEHQNVDENEINQQLGKYRQ